MNAEEYGRRIASAGGEVLAAYMDIRRDSRPWTNREILLLLDRAVVAGSQITLDHVCGPPKKATP